MTLADIKAMVMFQTNNDVDDLPDFTPYVTDYINEGYDRLVKVWADVHPETRAEDYPRLHLETEVPKLPEWTHRALADWATWLIYRNGNPQKQQRGYEFRNAFLELLNTLRSEGGQGGKVRNFYNIPR